MVQRRAREPKSTLGLRWNLSPQAQRDIAGVILLLIGALLLLTLLRITRGVIADGVAGILQALFGWGAYALPFVAFGAGVFLLRRDFSPETSIAWGRIFAGEIAFALVLALMHLIAAPSDAGAFAQSGNGGGFIGGAIAGIVTYFLGPTPSLIVLTILGVLLVPALLGLSTTQLRAWSEALAQRAEQTRPPAPAPIKLPPPPKPLVTRPPAGVPQPPPEPVSTSEEPEQSADDLPTVRPTFGTKPPMKTSTASQAILTPRRTRRRAPVLPSLDLLDLTSESKYGATDANRKARLIEETLAHFGVPVTVKEIHAGPTVTQFGLEPGFIERRGSDGQIRPRKVSVNRIAALQHDLELALAVAPIRIETPVPGKPIVGIEVPNQSVAVVSLRGVMESEVFKTRKKKTPLLIALGRDVSGAPQVADLGTMPHLLIAGATGSGKSVCINAIIACLIFNNSPDDLRLIMVDPKRVELINFNDIPHLLGPVVVNVEEVVACLRWLTREMDNRFTLFAREKVRTIEAFNEKMNKTNGDTMPYIVALVDELADVMLAAPEETEKLLTRLAQMARATGIHLIIATQRPSVDVVTGLIKANFPARISFAVTSGVDSRVVLDTLGAEKLLGRGDMLYMASDSSKLVRLQGCFVSDDEIARLVNFWRERALTDSFSIPRQAPWKDEVDNTAETNDDELIERAIALVRQSERTSISFLQRKLGIGYPRAARLMDQLEERGIVGPDEGAGKSRAVLVSSVRHLEVTPVTRRRGASRASLWTAMLRWAERFRPRR
jgi:S-DNA-T family DNA segregation ATPase FtsK/SpoIIIE